MATATTTRKHATTGHRRISAKAAPVPTIEVIDRTMMTATQARDNFAEVVNRVIYAGERIVVGKPGNPNKAVAVIRASELDVLEALEARFDLESALDAIRTNAGKKPIEWNELKKTLGL
jgi:antitoxin (DNA-binding transcriptional repressor) of toxin-antitoxin stability system